MPRGKCSVPVSRSEATHGRFPRSQVLVLPDDGRRISSLRDQTKPTCHEAIGLDTVYRQLLQRVQQTISA